MMRFLVSLAFAILASSCNVPRSSLAPVPVVENIEGEFRASYLVMVTCSDGGRQGGSAIAFTPHKLITAAHVVQCDEGATPIEIMLRQRGLDNVWKATLVRVAKEVDAALLNVSETSLHWMPLADYLPERGQRICVLSGMTHARKCGFVTETAGAQMSISDMMPYHGDSGSPFFDDKGRCVGILRAIWQQNNGEILTIAVSTTGFRELFYEP